MMDDIAKMEHSNEEKIPLLKELHQVYRDANSKVAYDSALEYARKLSENYRRKREAQA